MRLISEILQILLFGLAFANITVKVHACEFESCDTKHQMPRHLNPAPARRSNFA